MASRSNLNAWLESATGLKTETGAMRRIDKVMNLIEENGSRFMVYRKADGTFVPVIFASGKDWAVGAYAHSGIYVTN